MKGNAMSMHREDWERKFEDGKQWAAGHRQLVLIVATFVIAFTLGAVSCSSRAATINIPACDTLTVLGQTPSVITLACGHAPAPPPVVVPPPVAGTGCGEFTATRVEMAWPTGANNVKRSPSWTGDTAMVIHFKAGTTVGDTASLQFAHTGPPYQMMVAGVSTAPGCNVVRAFVPLMSAASGNPIFRFVVDGSKAGHITVVPGADYWITAVWRNGFGAQFVPSCVEGNCGAGVRFDFNTN